MKLDQRSDFLTAVMNSLVLTTMGVIVVSVVWGISAAIANSSVPNQLGAKINEAVMGIAFLMFYSIASLIAPVCFVLVGILNLLLIKWRRAKSAN